MKIKKVTGGDIEIRSEYVRIRSEDTLKVWVLWSDIKPILEEYMEAIENEQVGCSDYSLMTKDS